MAKESAKTIVYSALEVANLCGVVNQTVINWIKKGYLSAFSTPGNQYRIYQDDLISFMKSKNMRIPSEILNTENSLKKELKNMSVLIIDDEKGLNSVIAKYLEREFEGKKISSAFDTIEAGMMLSEKSHDIVLLDADTKGVDAIDFCKKIKQSDAFGNPELVVILGSRNGDIDSDLKSIGVEYVFTKPLNLDEIHSCFEKLFS